MKRRPHPPRNPRAKRPPAKRHHWPGDLAALQRWMLEVPLHILTREAGVPARRLVAFGNGSARPTWSQFKRIFDAIWAHAPATWDHLRPE